MLRQPLKRDINVVLLLAGYAVAANLPSMKILKQHRQQQQQQRPTKADRANQGLEAEL
jgi:hypothetical protein